MKKIKLSSLIFILLLIFLTIDFIGYRLLYHNIESNYEKDTKILFYKLQSHTSTLLTKLFYRYEQEKEKLLEKHEVVQAYLKQHDLNISLEKIYQQINEGYPDKPYHIYISDKDLIIRNTTLDSDLGFDLNFAKNIFEEHKSKHVVGISTPIRENKGNHFLSYTDSYLSRNGNDRDALLQVSYTYKDFEKEIIDIDTMIKKYPMLKSVHAFSFGKDGFVYEFLFMEPNDTRKSDMISANIKTAYALLKKLQDHELLEKTYTQVEAEIR